MSANIAFKSSYVEFRMDEWGIGAQSRRAQRSVRRVLNELHPEALLRLKDARLEMMVLPEADFSVWGYFPVHRLRLIARKLNPKPETRVLLVLSITHFDRQPVRQSCDELRDHLGHVLLYLRKPKARNECADALAEWGRTIRRAA